MDQVLIGCAATCLEVEDVGLGTSGSGLLQCGVEFRFGGPERASELRESLRTEEQEEDDDDDGDLGRSEGLPWMVQCSLGLKDSGSTAGDRREQDDLPTIDQRCIVRYHGPIHGNGEPHPHPRLESKVGDQVRYHSTLEGKLQLGASDLLGEGPEATDSEIHAVELWRWYLLAPRGTKNQPSHTLYTTKVVLRVTTIVWRTITCDVPCL